MVHGVVPVAGSSADHPNQVEEDDESEELSVWVEPQPEEDPTADDFLGLGLCRCLDWWLRSGKPVDLGA